MFDFFNRKISLQVAFIVIFLIAGLFSWLIIKEYEKVIKIRMGVLDIIEVK
ncbi:MAG: hypothetical protein PHI53_01900 [Candidatus Pacebacteria bacterium]|nr:hypothetical protein [Candidatus Paceibacterota bacterium]